jgi:prolyl oligopeptidase
MSNALTAQPACWRVLRRVSGALLAAVALIGASPAWAGPPPAPSHPVTDTLHGVAVADPYRNLEDVGNAETKAWLQAQGEFAAAQLASLGGGAELARRIEALAGAAGDTVYDVLRMPGERVYYLQRKKGQSQFKLMMRVGLRGAERVLVDPEQLAKATGVPHAINYFMPSWDGRTLAYGMSAGGSEDASLHLMDIASGRAIGQPVPRVHERLLSWTPDSRALSYNQTRQLAPGTPDTETFLDTTTWLLRLPRPGQGVSAPVPLFGPLVNPGLGLDRIDVAGVYFTPGSRWMMARTTDTTVPEGKLFVAPLAQLGRAGGKQPIAWRQISAAADKITDYAVAGDTLYLRTYAGAPRGRILALSLAHPDLAGARQVVAEPESAVLQGFGLGRDALYTQEQLGFNTRVKRHLITAQGRGLPVVSAGFDVAPGRPDSTALVDDASQAHTDVWLATSSWTEPPRVLAVSAQGAVSDTGLRTSRRPPGAPELQVSEVMVPSHDGVQVPMVVMHRQGLALDGSNPTLLVGYGAYGMTLEARYDPRAVAWFERGGVIALANVRGSGAFGDAWHRAGFKSTKPNTWKDGIACAKYLIDRGYTAPARLGVWGTSAGGIFVGRAVTSAPELFAAAIFDVGVMDAVRAEESANGITNISEFGSYKNADDFPAVLEMSTYHHITDGVAYPAVLLIHGMNDPRVDVWHSAKAAARLQAATSSGKPVLLRLDAQAGHGMGSTARQGYDKLADIYSFLLWQFGVSGYGPKVP